jgi:hypothetical protein
VRIVLVVVLVLVLDFHREQARSFERAVFAKSPLVAQLSFVPDGTWRKGGTTTGAEAPAYRHGVPLDA